MPLTENNYENFYLGNGAEYLIMSELFLLGVEAHKLNPDIGIDILVTNKAAIRFREKEEIQYHIQVKSSFLIKDEAKFYIHEDELNNLCSDKLSVTFFCYAEPVIKAEPQSFERGDHEPWWESEMASFDRHIYENEFHTVKLQGCLSAVDFKNIKINYIWLNCEQLKRAISEKYIYQTRKGKLYKLTINTKNGHPVIIGHKEIGSPVGEITNTYYLIKPCRGTGRLNGGDFLCEHY